MMGALQAYEDACTVYLHGFTGNPSGALEMQDAFVNPAYVQAPALPDTQKETGLGSIDCLCRKSVEQKY
jgi:hypothetical protein